MIAPAFSSRRHKRDCYGMRSAPDGAMNELQGLRSLRFRVDHCPLVKPYELSFGNLTEFDSVLVLAQHQNGCISIGEAVPLPGYNWETLETVRATVATLVANSNARSCSEVVEHCRALRAHH